MYNCNNTLFWAFRENHPSDQCSTYKSAHDHLASFPNPSSFHGFSPFPLPTVLQVVHHGSPCIGRDPVHQPIQKHQRDDDAILGESPRIAANRGESMSVPNPQGAGRQKIPGTGGLPQVIASGMLLLECQNLENPWKTISTSGKHWKAS